MFSSSAQLLGMKESSVHCDWRLNCPERVSNLRRFRGDKLKRRGGLSFNSSRFGEIKLNYENVRHCSNASNRGEKSVEKRSSIREYPSLSYSVCLQLIAAISRIVRGGSPPMVAGDKCQRLLTFVY